MFRKAFAINSFIAVSLLVIFLLIPHVLARAVAEKPIEDNITSQEAKVIAEEIVNTYLLKGKTAQPSGEPEEESGLYKVNFTLDDAQRPVYLTRDGRFFILPNGMMSVAEFKKKAAEAKKQPLFATKNIPSVELYVMSLCPYGVKAEREILPVIEHFGDDIDFKIKYIVDVTGNTIADVKSLRGQSEVVENLRQAAVMHYYPEKFPLYLDMVDEKSCLVSCGEVSLDRYWRVVAKKLRIDPRRIESFVEGEEGMSFLKKSSSDSKKYGIAASPTLIINGIKSQAIYQGAEAIKTAICSAFVSTPQDCKE
jgi:hypothetical protein